MRKHYCPHALAYILLVSGLSGIAMAGPFEDGVTAFRAGDLEQAQTHFETARTDQASPALLYNLGVVYYKQDRLALATETFTELTQHKRWAPLAHYNLALIARKQDAPEQAATHARTVIASSHDIKLLGLARRLLDEVTPEEPVLRTTAGIYAGFDDNVLLGLDPAASGSDEGDFFSELHASLDYPVPGDVQDLILSANTYALTYQDLDEYNYGSLRLGLRKGLGRGHWRPWIGVYFDYLTLDRDPFQHVMGISLSLDEVSGRRRPISLSLLSERISEDDAAYDYLAGTRHRLRAEHRRKAWGGKLGLRAELEYNDRDTLTVGNDTFSYSPAKLGLRGKWSWAPASRWETQFSVTAQAVRYQDEEIRNNVPEGEREDRLLALQVTLRYELDKQRDLEAQYTHDNNQSNFDEFDFTRNIIVFGISRYF